MADRAQRLPKPCQVNKSYANVLCGKWRPPPLTLESHSNIARVPTEIIENIVSYVDMQDVKTLRLALRACDKVGAKAIFNTVRSLPKFALKHAMNPGSTR